MAFGILSTFATAVGSPALVESLAKLYLARTIHRVAVKAGRAPLKGADQTMRSLAIQDREPSHSSRRLV